MKNFSRTLNLHDEHECIPRKFAEKLVEKPEMFSSSFPSFFLLCFLDVLCTETYPTSKKFYSFFFLKALERVQTFFKFQSIFFHSLFNHVSYSEIVNLQLKKISMNFEFIQSLLNINSISETVFNGCFVSS